MADIEKYKSLPDGIDTWIQIWRDGGDELIDAWSDWAGTTAPELISASRLKRSRRIGASVAAATCEEDLLRLIGTIHTSGYREIAANRFCSEQILELLWVGDYYNHLDRHDPQMVISSSFYNNHFKLTAIYWRKPDLRAVVAPDLRRMIEMSLHTDGKAIFPASEEDFEFEARTSMPPAILQKQRNH